MAFRFESDQQYQLDAIEAVAGLFAGQAARAPTVLPAAGTIVVPNRLDLTPDDLLENMQAVQRAAGLPKPDAPDAELRLITETVGLYGGDAPVSFPNFSVEMETGTGKTYVYIRTALTLAARHGLRKFIIVVPSVAVREGVVQTLKQTKTHFETLPGLPPFHHEVYDSSRPGQVRGFAGSTAVEMMVMTIDAFAKAANVINKTQEGNPPLIHTLQAVRPVLILDEPQNMESENRVRALAALHPLVALRYSATHRNPYNVVHRLTPFDAYRQELVKRIEVADVVESDNANLPYLRLEGVTNVKRTVSASITVDRMMKSGAIKRQAMTVRGGDDLAEKTRRAEYRGLVVDEINADGEFVTFANNLEIRRGVETGSAREAVFEAQIRYTITEHFRKQRRFRERGIKVLSLFFVDKVASFADGDGWVRTMFVKAFEEAKAAFPEWTDRKALDVQKSYFATKRRKGGASETVDSTGKSKEDDEAFRLIMQEKERLLSFDEPTAFIFSHSALREGWDNPNAFQICVLREVNEMTRRQQIGRGVRLPVTEEGVRVRDREVNVLTVVASETFQQFVAGLQGEIEAEYGKDGAPPPPANARARRTLSLRKELMLGEDFRQLWDRIKLRTRYAVKVDGDKLSADVVAELDTTEIRRPRITISKALLRVDADEDVFEAIVTSGAKTAIDLAGRFPLPNLVEVVEAMMEGTTPPMRLSRRTILKILAGTAKTRDMVDNPHDFAAALTRIVKDKLAEQLVGGIKYEPDGTWFEQSQFLDVIETYADRVVDSDEIDGFGGTHLYDGVPVDSETIERPFAEQLERNGQVKLYVKLPGWFTVDTPVGRYNPDWAVVLRGDTDRLFLVRETKGTANKSELRPDERRKVLCAEAHFAELPDVDYQMVTTGDELGIGGWAF